MKKVLILVVVIMYLSACALSAQAEGATVLYNVSGAVKIENDKMFTVGISSDYEDIKTAMEANNLEYLNILQAEDDEDFDFKIDVPVINQQHNLILKHSNRTYVRYIRPGESVYNIYIREALDSITVDADKGIIEISRPVNDEVVEVELLDDYGFCTENCSLYGYNGEYRARFKMEDNQSNCVVKIIGDDFAESYKVDVTESAVFDYSVNTLKHLVTFNLPEQYSGLSGNTQQRFEQALAELPDEVTVIEPLNIKNKTEIYVSPAGSDSADGSVETPVQTIDKALDILKESQHSGIVVLREGTYNISEPITINAMHNADGKSGTTLIKGYEGETVNIVSGIQLSASDFEGTDLGGGNIVKLDLNALMDTDYDPRKVKLLVDNVELQKSRWPENDEVMMGDITYGGPVDNGQYIGGESKISYISLWNKPFEWDLSKGVYFNGAIAANGRWDTYVYGIGKANAETYEITVNGYSYVGQAKGHSEGVTHFYDNVFEEIDVPGEWSIDTENNILYIYETDNFETAKITLINESQPMFNVSDVSNIVFDNINFSNGYQAIQVTNCEDVIIQYCTFENFINTAVTMSGTKNSGLIYSSIYNVEDRGISIMGWDSVESMWESEELKNLTPTRNFVQNCNVIDCGYIGISVQQGIGDVVSHNYLGNMFETAIFLKHCVETIVEYNEVADFGTDVWDCGAIYCSGIPLNRGNHIRNNYIHDSLSGGVGIYFDGSTMGNYAYENLLLNTKNAFSINGGRETALVNNIVATDDYLIHDDRTTVFVAFDYYDDQFSTNDSFFKPNFISADGFIQKFMKSDAFDSGVLKNRYPEMYLWLEDVQDMLDARLAQGSNYVRGDFDDINDPENRARAPYDIFVSNNVFPSDVGLEFSWVHDTWPIVGLATNFMYKNVDEIGFQEVDARDFSMYSDANVFSEINNFRNPEFEKMSLTDATNRVAMRNPDIYALKYYHKISGFPYKYDFSGEKSLKDIHIHTGSGDPIHKDTETNDSFAEIINNELRLFVDPCDNRTDMNRAYNAVSVKIPYSGLAEDDNLRISFDVRDTDGVFNSFWQNFGTLVNNEGKMVIWGRRDSESSGRFWSELGAKDQIMLIGYPKKASSYNTGAIPADGTYENQITNGGEISSLNGFYKAGWGGADIKGTSTHNVRYDINRKTEEVKVYVDSVECGTFYIMNEITESGYLAFTGHAIKNASDEQWIDNVRIEIWRETGSDSVFEKDAQTVIKWQKVAGAHSYKVTVAADEKFENVVYEETVYTPEISLNCFLDNDRYFVKVSSESLSKPYISRKRETERSFLAVEYTDEKIVLLSFDENSDGYTYTLKNTSDESVTVDLYVARMTEGRLTSGEMQHNVVIPGNQILTGNATLNGAESVVLYVWDSLLAPQRRPVIMQ